MSVDVEKLKREVAARRTFAIISHPDAGKTTLTEKVLLYGGADPPRGLGQAEPRRQPRGHQRLDGDRAPARHLDLDQRAAVRVSRAADQPARHARPQRLQRGHLPHAGRRRLGGHAHRQRQGRRAADHQALPGLPHARHPDHHVHQQARPRRQGAARPARRDRARARHPVQPGQLADRLRARASSASTIAGASARCTSSAPRAAPGAPP